jgi:YggT family protein
MKALLWIVRIYRWWMFGWVLLTWIPVIAGSHLHMLLGLPVIPVLRIFDFLSVGGLGFGPLIPLYGLFWLDRFLQRQLEAQRAAAAGQAPGPMQQPVLALEPPADEAQKQLAVTPIPVEPDPEA